MSGHRGSESLPLRGRRTAALQDVLQTLEKGSAEERAVVAGEIDAVVDYSRHNVILFPAARIALRERAARIAAAKDSLAGNLLLASLPKQEHLRLLGGLERLEVQAGTVLHQPGQPVRQVYFPIDSVVCMMTAVEERGAVGIGLVGHEGMVGIALALGLALCADPVLVVGSGTALRMEAAYLQAALTQCPRLQGALHRFAFMKLTLARRAVGCLCAHRAEARLAHWLLMMSDRVRAADFFFTHESLALVLGLRRCTITESAVQLQSLKLIRYRRGNIRVLDRAGLEKAACTCYRPLAEHLQAETLACAIQRLPLAPPLPWPQH